MRPSVRLSFLAINPIWPDSPSLTSKYYHALHGSVIRTDPIPFRYLSEIPHAICSLARWFALQLISSYEERKSERARRNGGGRGRKLTAAGKHVGRASEQANSLFSTFSQFGEKYTHTELAGLVFPGERVNDNVSSHSTVCVLLPSN